MSAIEMRLWEDRLATPIGELVLLVDDAGALRAVDWSDHVERMRRLLRLQGAFDRAVETERRRDPFGLTSAMRAYFGGEIAIVDGLPVAAMGTEFQLTVWRALRTIPAGGTLSYGGLARVIARPSATRAVGAANGANPVGIVVPCHRVIGADGSLTGYGGGMDRKRWLLRHEGAIEPLLRAP